MQYYVVYIVDADAPF